MNNEIYIKAKDYSMNKSDLTTYYNVGKLLADAFKHYGEGVIKEYSKKLIRDVGKKYNERTLRRMRQFYKMFENQKWSPFATDLSWSHWVELLSIKDINEVMYYVKLTKKLVLSRNDLRGRIKNDEYGRLDDETKNKLIKKEENTVQDFIKNPIIIKNKNDVDVTKLSEKMLKQLILEDMEDFLVELGEGFCFIKIEYKIKFDYRYNYIDILLFNYIYSCFGMKSVFIAYTIKLLL